MKLVDIFEDRSISIEWKLPYNSKDRVAVWIDVAKLDKSWQQDIGFYITSGGGGAAIKNRYERFGEWLKQKLPVEMPEVGYNDYRKCVCFGNGRHRFSWMRDHGAKALPVFVAKEQAAFFQKNFETALHQTVIKNPA